MAKQALIMTATKVLIDWNADIDYTTLEPDTYRPAEHTIITVSFTNPPAGWQNDVYVWNAFLADFVKKEDTDGCQNGYTNYGDPWEPLDGELYADDFVNFSGWDVYSGADMTTSPSVDTAAGLFRAKGANPCIDATLRPRGIVVQPDHTANGAIFIARDIATDFGFDGDGPWTIMARANIPNHRIVANNSVLMGMGLSLPGLDSMQRNGVEIYPMDTDDGPDLSGLQCHRLDNGVAGDITEWNIAPADFTLPNGIWFFMYHENAASVVNCFFSIDGGHTLCELGTVTKDPATFTHLYFTFLTVKQMVTHPMINLCYLRVYDSVKTR